MKPGFFQSKEFVISAVVAALLITGSVVALTNGNFMGGTFHDAGCTVEAPAGASLAVTPEDTGARPRGARYERTITYTLDPPPGETGAISACTRVGDLTLEPSPDERVHVVFTVRSHGRGGEEAVAGAEVAALFTNSDGRLGIATWQEKTAGAWSLFGRRSASVALHLQVPDRLYDVEAVTDVGDLTARNLRVQDARVSTDVGDLTTTGVHATGNLTASTDVGDLALTLASVQTGRVVVSTDVGDARLTLPDRADVGYKVHAKTDVGNVEIEIGSTESTKFDDDDPAGDEVQTQTAGYEGKPTKVDVRATADVGDVTITTQ